VGLAEAVGDLVDVEALPQPGLALALPLVLGVLRFSIGWHITWPPALAWAPHRAAENSGSV
jgi:hypothetical protein